MSFAEFWHVQAAPSAQEAFDILAAEARLKYGHRPGQTGTIGDLVGVGTVYDSGDDPDASFKPILPTSLERAQRIADERGYGDADIAYAIELKTAPGDPRSWFVFGRAHY